MSDVTVIPVVDFPDHLSQGSDPYVYSDCDVISITHAKNIDSGFKHEYLHVIIRHRPSSSWRRLLVERQDTQDQVVVGFWPWVGRDGSAVSDNAHSSNSSIPDSGDSKLKVPTPILMRNISGFDPLTLQSVASVLLEVHRQQPEYRSLVPNCYWYSDAVFQILRGMARNADYREWPWVKLRQRFFFFSASAQRAAAERFVIQMKIIDIAMGQDFGLDEVDDHGEPGNPELEAKTISQDTEDAAEDAGDYSYAPAVEEVLFKENKVAEDAALFIKGAYEGFRQLDEPAICRATEARKEDTNAFSTHVLANPEKEANLAFYESCLSGSRGIKELDQDELDPYIAELLDDAVRIDSAEVPSVEEEARYDEAVRAFAGGVLRKLREDGISFGVNQNLDES